MKKYLNIVLTTLFCICSHTGRAQTTAALSQYYYDKMYYDIAFAPIDGQMELSANARWQWSGIDGAPQTYSLSWRMPLLTERGAMGANVVYDRIGNFRTLIAKAGYAYSIPLGRSMISAGLTLGVESIGVDERWIQGLPDDPSVPYGDTRATAPNVGVGFALWGEKYYIGLSSHNTIPMTQKMGEVDFQHKNQLFLMGGYSFPVRKSLRICPSGLLSTDMAVYSFSGNVSLVIKDRLIAGVSYRSDLSAGINVGYRWGDMQLCYCYEMGFDGMYDSSSGSHELLFIYRPTRKAKADKRETSPIVRNVRSL